MTYQTNENNVIKSMPFSALVRPNVGQDWKVNGLYVRRHFDHEVGKSFVIETDRNLRMVQIREDEAQTFCIMLDKAGSDRHVNACVETAMLGTLTLHAKNVPPHETEGYHLLEVSVWPKDLWFKLREGVPEQISAAISDCLANEELRRSA